VKLVGVFSSADALFRIVPHKSGQKVVRLVLACTPRDAAECWVYNSHACAPRRCIMCCTFESEVLRVQLYGVCLRFQGSLVNSVTWYMAIFDLDLPPSPSCRPNAQKFIFGSFLRRVAWNSMSKKKLLPLVCVTRYELMDKSFLHRRMGCRRLF